MKIWGDYKMGKKIDNARDGRGVLLFFAVVCAVVGLFFNWAVNYAILLVLFVINNKIKGDN